MVIQHNLRAMNAHRRFGINVREQGKSIEKLSSGARINRSADDAAGLAISEKMRSQIRGLEQGSTNSQDAISMVQATEGGMNEVHNMLQRCKTLATQASNGSLATIDRSMADSEIQQIKEEIDRIAEQTTFNGKKVLNGELSEGKATREEQETALDALSQWWIPSAQTVVQSVTGLNVNNVPLKVIMNDNMAATNPARVNYNAADYTNPSLELELSTSAIKGYDPTNDQDGKTGSLYVDRIIAHELTHATMAANTNMQIQPTWFLEGVAEVVHGADERLDSSINSGQTVSQLVNLISSGNWIKNPYDSNASNQYSGAYIAARFMNEAYATSTSSHDGIKNILTQLKNNASDNTYTFDDALNDAHTTASGNTTYGSDASYTTTSGFLNKLTSLATGGTLLNDAKIDLTNSDTGSLRGSDATGFAPSVLNASDVISEPGTPLMGTAPTGTAEPIWGFLVDFSEAITSGSGLDIQVGGTMDEVIKISGGNVSCSALGIDKISVSTRTDAVNALGVIDNAINNLSTQRANLGALQNRLEHTIAATDNTAENLTASESKIRDTDMAKEMMAYTKNNILTSAAQSMLAQANQEPQNILSLLQ